jgi:hypothetical protein
MKVPSRGRSYAVAAAAALFLLLAAGAAALTPAADAKRTLVARATPSKPANAAIPPGYSHERLHLKFREGSGVRLRGNRFVSESGANLSGLTSVLARYPGTRIQRLFERPEGVLAREKARIEAKAGRQQADKNLYYRLVLSKGTDAEALLDALNALAVVEISYAEPLPSPPPATPDFTGQQGYREAATDGIDADFAETVPGGTGANVRIIDIEYSWNQSHEDLSKATSALIANKTPDDPFNSNDHGTAVIGEMVADDNAFGVTGIAHGAALGLVNADNEEDDYDLADSIDIAAANLSAGDVIIIEQQVSGPNGCMNGVSGCVAVEWTQAYYDAIVSATSAGINVLEAAGNGNENLDDSATYGSPFPDGRADSGAIIVGAGSGGCTSTSHTRRRLNFSTFGSRVNLQGSGQ